jgi:hypothetical protein
MISMSRWAWLAMFAIGCGHPSAPANPGRGSAAPAAAPDAAVEAPLALENDLPQLAERGVKLFADTAAALTAAGEDCAAATTKLDAIADANTDVIAANQHVQHAGHEKIKALKQELEKHQAELDASAQTIATSPAMHKCSSDAAFAKAFERLGGEG